MSEKTEQPTDKKIRDARKKGQVARSKDLTQTALILALLAYLVGQADQIIRLFGEMILLPGTLYGMEFEAAANAAWTRLWDESINILLPVLLIVLGIGIFFEVLQVGFLMAFEAIKPSGQKLDPIGNLKNMFSKKSLVDFLKSLIKIAILISLVYILLRDNLGGMMTIPRAGLPGVGSALGSLMKSMLVYLSIAYVILSFADFGWQRFSYRQNLMMTKDEVKKEYKESEGDPHIKHHRRHLHRELLAEESMDRARHASVLVTNPTHLAISIKYEEELTPLPVVTAMGEDDIAQMMIEAAQEAGVPVMQDIPLAHSLYYSASINEYIPADLIAPVAQVLRMVSEMKKENDEQSGGTGEDGT